MPEKEISERAAEGQKENLRAPRQESSFEKRLSMFAKANTVRAQPSKR